MLPLPLALSTHAIVRYRRRVKRGASVDEITAVLKTAVVQEHAPGWVHTTERDETEAWAVSRHVCFPLVRSGPSWLAVTCLKQRRIPKADRLAYRELRRDTTGRNL